MTDSPVKGFPGLFRSARDGGPGMSDCVGCGEIGIGFAKGRKTFEPNLIGFVGFVGFVRFSLFASRAWGSTSDPLSIVSAPRT